MAGTGDGEQPQAGRHCEETRAGTGRTNATLIPPARRSDRGVVEQLAVALLDQRVVAGLGNIYVCEALFRAGIHPTRPAGRIGPDRVARLHAAIREVLWQAIEAGGSSLRDHRQTSGELGYFQHSFRVYGREGQPCLREGCGGTVRRIAQSGRSTWYCPVCQR